MGWRSAKAKIKTVEVIMLDLRKTLGAGALVVVFSLANLLQGSTSRTFTFSINDVSFDTLQGFDVVDMPGADKVDTLGKPNLPYYHYNFIIRNSMDVSSVQITASNSENVDGSYYVYPAQPDVKTCYPPDQVEFVDPDSATYNSSNPYPGVLAECVDMGFFDGANKIARIAVYPLQYRPSMERLILYTSSA